MPKETMTPRERWQAVLDRRRPDRVPTDYWGTAETTTRLREHLGRPDWPAVLERLHIDQPLTVGGRYVGPKPADGFDYWGVGYRTVDYGAGLYSEIVSHPLARFETVEEIEKEYRWPSADWWDYSHLPGAVAGQEKRPIRGGGSEPFLRYAALRGQEQAYMDLVLNPPMVHYCLDRLFDLAYQDTLRIFETIPHKVMITYVAEDLGSQEGLLFSIAHIREFLFPRMKRMMDLARQHGSHVFTHSDGAVRPVIADLIALGVEVLNPIQWRCKGMEREGLKRDFGGRLIFHGGVDNQHTLPFGSAGDVRREVRDNLRILGAGGGYILAPCHNIQSITPMANVVAMYETAYEDGWT